MKILEKIKSPIKKEMDLFEEKFSSSMISDVPLLNRITHYVVKRKGKQMRPMFVFLTAKMMSNNGCVNEKVFRAWWKWPRSLGLITLNALTSHYNLISFPLTIYFRN